MPVSHSDGGKWKRLCKRERHVVLEPACKQSKDSWVLESCSCNTDASSSTDCNSQDIGLCLESVFLNSIYRERERETRPREAFGESLRLEGF